MNNSLLVAHDICGNSPEAHNLESGAGHFMIAKACRPHVVVLCDCRNHWSSTALKIYTFQTPNSEQRSLSLIQFVGLSVSFLSL